MRERSVPARHPRARALWVRRVRRRLRGLAWALVVGLGLVALILGMAGFDRHFDAVDAPRSFWDLLYASIQLLALDSGSVTPPVPWPLQVARLLAPAVAAYAAVRALAALFRERLARLRARWLARGHVVVCGLGRCGARLARSFREEGYRVVAVERDGGAPAIVPLRDTGVAVLSGDATDPAVLRAAGVRRARHLVAACGDDGANAEVVVTARGLGRAPGRAALDCFVRVLDDDLCALLRESVLAAGEGEAFRLEFFNPSEQGAPVLIEVHPPFDHRGRTAAGPPHVLVVGLGQMGSRLIAHMARSWRKAGGGSRRRLPVTVVDLEAERRIRDLALRHAGVEAVCELAALDLDVDGHPFRRGGFLGGGEGQPPVTAAYVCLDDDDRGLRAGLAVRRRLPDPAVPVVVRMNEHAGLARLLEAHGGAAGVDAFALLDRTCRPDVLLAGVNETLARAIHAEYVRHQRTLGRTPAENPSMVGWDRLPESLRESNRRQAAAIGRGLRAIGCDVAPLAGWDAPPPDFRPEEVEVMARLEHDRWCRERRAEGWTHGPERDERRRHHPALVPWEELSDDLREYDRATVRAFPAFLAEVGFGVVRAGPAAGGGELPEEHLEPLARAIHEDYVRRERAGGATPQTNPSVVGWEDLPETLRRSNRDQARDVGAKLAAIGCEVRPARGSGTDRFAFTPEEVERLARMEHARWWRDRVADAWTFGPEKDVSARVSPHLVAWEDLSEEVREYDREAVRALPELLSRVGLEIHRREEAVPHGGSDGS